MTDPELALLIVERYKEQHRGKDWRKELLADNSSIFYLFIWDKTQERYNFWREVDIRLGNNVDKFLKRNLKFIRENFVDLQVFI